MSAKWKATMPKEPPKQGESNVVFAFKNERGARSEFTGSLSSADAQYVMGMIIQMSRAK